MFLCIVVRESGFFTKALYMNNSPKMVGVTLSRE